MPIYEYRCTDCEQIFEEWQRDHEDRSVNCPVCGGEAKRIISNTSFVLKGTGWYVTDYSNGRSPQASGGDGNGNGNGKSAAADSGGSEAKPVAPPAPAKEAPAKSTSPTTQS